MLINFITNGRCLIFLHWMFFLERLVTWRHRAGALRLMVAGSFLWNSFKDAFEFGVRDSTFFTLIINGCQVNSGSNNLNVSNHPCTTTFAFTFSCNSQPYFVKIVTEGDTLFRVFSKFFNKCC